MKYFLFMNWCNSIKDKLFSRKNVLLTLLALWLLKVSATLFGIANQTQRTEGIRLPPRKRQQIYCFYSTGDFHWSLPSKYHYRIESDPQYGRYASSFLSIKRLWSLNRPWHALKTRIDEAIESVLSKQADKVDGAGKVSRPRRFPRPCI